MKHLLYHNIKKLNLTAKDRAELVNEINKGSNEDIEKRVSRLEKIIQDIVETNE